MRVERIFVSGGGDANQVAQDADALFYGPEAATVTVSTPNGNSATLTRVDGEDFGLSRDAGTFVNSPNILYRLDGSDLNLNTAESATIEVTTDQGTTAEATTALLPEIEIRNPQTEQGINPRDYSRMTTFRWDANGPEARVFDLRLYYNIREITNDGTNEVIDVRLEQVINRAFIRPDDGDIITFQISNESIWQFIGANLDEDAPVDRIFDDFEFEITAVGSEIEELIDLSNANSGITSAQAPPLYTNVEGGLGVVTSRTKAVLRDIPLNAQSREELRDGTYTSNLNFQ